LHAPTRAGLGTERFTYPSVSVIVNGLRRQLAYESVAHELPVIPQELNLQTPALAGVKAVLALASATGGCGRSTLAANLAIALVLKKCKVGVIDANFSAPALPTILGVNRIVSSFVPGTLEPTSAPLGIRVIAADPDFDPHPLDLHEEATSALNGSDAGITPLSIERIATQARLGALDLLVVDLPVGVAPVIELARYIPQARVLWLMTNSRLSTNATRRALRLARASGIASLGLLENLQGFYCGGCHTVRPLLPNADGATLSREFGLPSFGHLPFDSRLAECADSGRPFIREYPDLPLAKLLVELAANLMAALTPAAIAKAAPT